MPPDLGRRYLIFVDTEEEFDWDAGRRRGATATTAIHALPAAHQRFVQAGAKPCYLIDYPVADDPHSAAIIRDLARKGATIGAQLHAWVNPPFEEDMTDTNSFVGNLPISLERAKLRQLTERIEDMVGIRPWVYRGGRYGVGPNSARVLKEAGYRLDVSVRALFEYRREGGPDFSRHPVWPWWVDDAQRLLTLPLGAGYTGRVRSAGRWIFPISRHAPHVRGFLARAGLLSRVALTPEDMPIADVLTLIDVMLESDLQLFSFSYHSPSLEPGHTPYVRDRADLLHFWQWWDAVFDRLARAGIRSIDPLELLAAVDTGRIDRQDRV